MNSVPSIRFRTRLAAYLATCLLAIPAQAQERPRTVGDLVSAFRQAHHAKDAKQMEALFCQDGVPRRSKDQSAFFQMLFSSDITGMEVDPLNKRFFPEEQILNGIRCRLNLPPSKDLAIGLESPRIKERYLHLPLGEKDGRFYILRYIPAHP